MDVFNIKWMSELPPRARLLSGPKTRQVDYTQAFPHAPLDDPVFMCMPQGWFIDEQGILQPHLDTKFHDREQFIQLKKNLYGCKQAACN